MKEKDSYSEYRAEGGRAMSRPQYYSRYEKDPKKKRKDMARHTKTYREALVRHNDAIKKGKSRQIYVKDAEAREMLKESRMHKSLGDHRAADTVLNTMHGYLDRKGIERGIKRSRAIL